MTDSISRRDFLKLAGVGVAAATVAAELTNISGSKEYPELTDPEKTILVDIEKYRKIWGLQGLPEHIYQAIYGNQEWAEGEDFNNQLPENIQSYGVYINECANRIFGREKSRILIKGARVNPNNPISITFSSGERICNIQENIRDVEPLGDFAEKILHEAIGHGSDPELAHNLYSKKDLLTAEHGRWKALTQALSVPGEFFNHPEDLTLSKIAREIGSQVGQALKRGNLNEILDAEDIDILAEIKSIVGEDKDLRSMVYKKSVCEKIGMCLFELLLNQKLTFNRELSQSYSSFMEAALFEIYAEMVRKSINQPQVVNNKIVFEGVSDVLGTIYPPSADITKLKDFLSPSTEVQAMYLAEGQAIDASMSGNSQIFSSESPDKPAMSHQVMKKRGADSFDNFIKNGMVPDNVHIASDAKGDISAFAGLSQAIFAKYPFIGDLGWIINDRRSDYDPDIDYWDLEAVANATNTEFIRIFLNTETIDPNMLEQIKHKNVILRKALDENLDLNR